MGSAIPTRPQFWSKRDPLSLARAPHFLQGDTPKDAELSRGWLMDELRRGTISVFHRGKVLCQNTRSTSGGSLAWLRYESLLSKFGLGSLEAGEGETTYVLLGNDNDSGGGSVDVQLLRVCS